MVQSSAWRTTSLSMSQWLAKLVGGCFSWLGGHWFSSWCHRLIFIKGWCIDDFPSFFNPSLQMKQYCVPRKVYPHLWISSVLWGKQVNGGGPGGNSLSVCLEKSSFQHWIFYEMPLVTFLSLDVLWFCCAQYSPCFSKLQIGKVVKKPVVVAKNLLQSR